MVNKDRLPRKRSLEELPVAQCVEKQRIDKYGPDGNILNGCQRLRGVIHIRRQ